MSQVFLQGSIGSIFVHQTGHTHARSVPTDDDVPTSINCPECEPYLVKELGAVYKKELVPLTERQIEARERMKEEGNAAVSEAAKALAATASATSKRYRDEDEFERRVEAGVRTALATGAIVTSTDA